MSAHNLSALSRLAVAVSAGAALFGAASVALAQDAPTRKGASAALMEEVVVTARKRQEDSQDVPLSISALGADQLDALKVRDLTNLSVGLPNVSLDDIGTTRGTANFMIRGLGINSSIPSIDPTVGVFVNGVYIGMNNGLIFDVFDLESVEVLRGPQGTLFGRNVTGGAILMNTKRPGEETEAVIRTAVDGGGDGGLNYYTMGSVGGAITENFKAKVTAYYNKDEGYFQNDFLNENVGGIEQVMFRPSFVWDITESTELFVNYEYTDIEGDGPVSQSHTNGFGVDGTPTNFDRKGFGFSIDEKGYQTIDGDFITVHLNQDVDFGEGRITAIYGWRDLESEAYIDVDAQPVQAFHSRAWLESEQDSLEVRYNGQFGAANITTGVFWFEHEMAYQERRHLFGAVNPAADYLLFQDGGGYYNVETTGIFASVDYALTEQLILNLGIRYSEEEKDAEIASLGGNVAFYPLDGCYLTLDGRPCKFDFVDDENWSNWSPKLGFSYLLSDEAQVYGSYSRAFRSGGYNLRNSVPGISPGPFDEEQVDNIEFGYKSTSDWGKLNAALFYTEISDMQREINLADPAAGVLQLIRNSGDATLMGFEVDTTVIVSDGLLLLASLGYIDAEYDKVTFDLNGDGVVDSADKNLDLPRAPELTYSVGLTYDFDVGADGYASARINYAYRDEVAYTDNNRGYIDEQDILDMGVDYYTNDGHWRVGLYGRNMLDTVKHGGDTQLPTQLGPLPLGGTFSPLAKGQVYGVDAQYTF